jgi:hypothetical protein
VVVVSEAFARRFYPDSDAVGQYMIISGKLRRIAGVAEDGPSNHLHEAPEPYVYFPFAQRPSGELVLIVEPAVAGLNLIPTLRRELRQFDPAAALLQTTTLRHMHEALSVDRTMASVATVLGSFGLVMTAAGLFGVIQHGVNRRTRELGLRMALGARACQVRTLVFRDSLKVAAAGLPAGFLLQWGLGRYVQSLLLDVTPGDFLILYGLSGLGVLAIVVTASWVPARTATTIAPMKALGSE